MASSRRILFVALLQTQRLLMALGISRLVRKIPLAYSAYQFLYRRWVPRGRLSVDAQGHKLFLDPGDMGIARAFLLCRGRWEESETRLFCSLVREGMTVVDVGANIGYYTLLAARLVGRTGRVFAFEPDPRNFALLERNVAANGYRNVVLARKAVSDKTATATLRLDRTSSGGHRLSHLRGAPDSIEVETVCLDHSFADQQAVIDVVKMDAEGAEMAILNGMRDVLARNPHLTLLTEFFPRAIQDLGYPPEAFLEELTELGFRIYRIHRGRRSPERIEGDRFVQVVAPADQQSIRQDAMNLLCLRGNGATRFRGELQ